MTHTSQQTKIVYEPDGTATSFTVPFPVYDAADLECVSVGIMEETLYSYGFTVSGIGQGNVTVTFADPPPAGSKLVIRRSTRRVQESDYPVSGRFPAKVVEHDLDRIVAMIQELAEELSRALKAPYWSDLSPEEIVRKLLLAHDLIEQLRESGFVLMPAARDRLGGVIVGSGLSVALNGLLDVDFGRRRV